MKIEVTIDRGQGKKERFTGELVAEGSSHVRVQHDKNHDGEWFCKDSKCVKVEKVSE